MKVKFMQDFRGAETHEQWYPQGTVVDLDAYAARSLIGDGFAQDASREEITAEVELSPEEQAVQAYDLTQIDGIGEARLDDLRELGVLTVVDLAHVSAGTLQRGINRLSEKQAKAWIAEARQLLAPVPEMEA